MPPQVEVCSELAVAFGILKSGTKFPFLQSISNADVTAYLAKIRLLSYSK